jgi:2-phospho-L-lactate guanylyltransferase
MDRTSLPVMVAVPVKPFDAAKQRLSDVLGPVERRHLSERLARRTASVVAETGATPLILSADDEVTEWARGHDIEVLLDEGSSLDQAATAAVAWASERAMGWIVLHADLPLLDSSDLARPVEIVASGGAVLAPSSDGGTSLIGANHTFTFAYGPASFHRHLIALGRMGDPQVVTGIGLSLDLDIPGDLTAARRHPRGRWL